MSIKVSEDMPPRWTSARFLDWHARGPHDLPAGIIGCQSGEVEFETSSHDDSDAVSACEAAGDDLFDLSMNGLGHMLLQSERDGGMTAAYSLEAKQRVRAPSRAPSRASSRARSRAPSRPSGRAPSRASSGRASSRAPSRASLRIPSASSPATASSGRPASKRSFSSREHAADSDVVTAKRLRVTPRARTPSAKKEKKSARGRAAVPAFVMEPGVKYVGRYKVGAERQDRIARFMEKRKCRNWTKRIMYDSRARIAMERLRGAHGQFDRPKVVPQMEIARQSMPQMEHVRSSMLQMEYAVI